MQPGKQTRKSKAPKSELLSLANVGPSISRDLNLCGIETISQLAKQEPAKLYQKLCALTLRRQDPCVWDVFAAAIHEAKTGTKTQWWTWTAERKKRNLAL